MTNFIREIFTISFMFSIIGLLNLFSFLDNYFFIFQRHDFSKLFLFCMLEPRHSRWCIPWHYLHHVSIFGPYLSTLSSTSTSDLATLVKNLAKAMAVAARVVKKSPPYFGNFIIVSSLMLSVFALFT